MLSATNLLVFTKYVTVNSICMWASFETKAKEIYQRQKKCGFGMAAASFGDAALS